MFNYIGVSFTLTYSKLSKYKSYMKFSKIRTISASLQHYDLLLTVKGTLICGNGDFILGHLKFS